MIDLAQNRDLPLLVIDLQQGIARDRSWIILFSSIPFAFHQIPVSAVMRPLSSRGLWENLKGEGYTHLATGHYARLLTD